MSETSPVQSKKVHPENEDLESLSKGELIARLKEQEQYIKQLESKKLKLDKDDDADSEDRLKNQQKEAARKENTLVHRLTLKEQELQEYMTQITEIKQAQTQGTAQLRTMLLDPAVNIVFQRMSKEMDEAQEKLKQTQNELSAWKFTPDSQTGKRLMARCQMLLQENEELGKTISSGRTAKLEGEIALQKTLVTEMKNNQSELDEFLGDLEEDVEGMQTMIYVLQQQLRESKEQITALEEENTQLRNGGGSSNHYKTFAVKQRDKLDTEVKSETTRRHPEYDSYEEKTRTDYAPMEMAGYYQNDKTDSDLEAEYNYEGLYENEDKYQEELETQQKGTEKQYGYEENGYRSYGEDSESHSQQEAMDTSEIDPPTTVSNPDIKSTSRADVVEKDPSNSDCKHTTNNNYDTNRQLKVHGSSMETDTQQQTVTTKHRSEMAELSKEPFGNGHQLDNSNNTVSTEQLSNTDKTAVKQQQTSTQGNVSTDRTSDQNRTSNDGQVERTAESNTDPVHEGNNKDRTPERQRIPSPNPSKVSPSKTNSTKTVAQDRKDDESKTDKSNSVKDSKDTNSPPSPTDIGTNNKETKSVIREREPVLQQFLNGITSTVDDIEDL